MSSFDEVTKWPVGPDGVGRGQLPESWMQGRGAFGALVAAIGLDAVAGQVSEPPVRSVITHFLGPLLPEVPASCVATVLRRGRSVTVAEARITQQDSLRGLVQVTHGASRPSKLSVPAPEAPAGPPPGDGARFGYIPGVSPQFLQHLDMRWTDGQPPFTGATDATIGGWCRHATPATGLGAVLGLLDAWPAPVLSMGTRPFPASTVHWTAYLQCDAVPPAGAWLRFRARCETAGAGYATMVSHLWDDQGQLVAWSEQLVAVFDQA